MLLSMYFPFKPSTSDINVIRRFPIKSVSSNTSNRSVDYVDYRDGQQMTSTKYQILVDLDTNNRSDGMKRALTIALYLKAYFDEGSWLNNHPIIAKISLDDPDNVEVWFN